MLLLAWQGSNRKQNFELAVSLISRLYWYWRMEMVTNEIRCGSALHALAHLMLQECLKHLGSGDLVISNLNFLPQPASYFKIK